MFSSPEALSAPLDPAKIAITPLVTLMWYDGPILQVSKNEISNTYYLDLWWERFDTGQILQRGEHEIAHLKIYDMLVEVTPEQLEQYFKKEVTFRQLFISTPKLLVAEFDNSSPIDEVIYELTDRSVIPNDMLPSEDSFFDPSWISQSDLEKCFDPALSKALLAAKEALVKYKSET